MAAENLRGSITAQVGDSRVKVTSIVTYPTADPHPREPNAANAAAPHGPQTA